MATISAINRLLNKDLLCEIFALVSGMDNAAYISYPFHDPRQSRSPLLITYVCSHWRTIALETPSLWSSLRVDVEHLLIRSGRQEVYRLWLDRAWGTPVSLNIIDIRASRVPVLDTVDWIGFLLEHIPYLQYLLTGPSVGNALFKGLLSKPKGSARHLQGICIAYPSQIPFSQDCYGKLSTLVPSLSQLDLSAPSYHGFRDLRIHQLTHFSCDITFFEDFNAGDAAELTFPALLELHIHRGSGGQPPEPQHLGEIILPEARIIKVHDTIPDALLTRALLPVVRCPKLEILSIENGYIATSPIPTSPPDTGDFTFFTLFMAHAPCLRQVYARHQNFLTTAFLKHHKIRSQLDFVQVTIPVAGARFRTVDAARQSFGAIWAAHNLEVVFLTGPEDIEFSTHTAFIGWSRAAGQGLGVPYIRRWVPPFWDQGAYAHNVSKVRPSRLVAS